MDFLKLGDYTDQEISLALDRNNEIIERHRGLKPPQPTGFWKAVENRQKLSRELRQRGILEDPKVVLPGDRLPTVNIQTDLFSEGN